SDEAPELPGLGVLKGRVVRLHGQARLKADTTGTRASNDASARPGFAADVKVPHVGWNSLTLTRDASIADGVASGAQVYFTDSYVAPVTDDTAAITEHGDCFAAIVQRGTIAGVQFHPEKSGEIGLQVLRNFLRCCRSA